LFDELSCDTMPQSWQIHPNVTGASWRSTAALANLELRDVVKPTPQPGTALVRIRAVALNARDLMVIANDPVYPTKAVPGISPCSDGAGIVEAVGEPSVWKVGDRVILAQNSWINGLDAAGFDINSALGGGGVQGTLRQYALVKDDYLLRAPKNLSFEEAAVIPTAGGTAANALFFGPMKTDKGVTILTQGTGGVSTFAIQVRCRHRYGNREILTDVACSSCWSHCDSYIFI
jgi:NADPH:quinone reductase-like Zn-dependent oxidoreductase